MAMVEDDFKANDSDKTDYKTFKDEGSPNFKERVRKKGQSMALKLDF